MAAGKLLGMKPKVATTGLTESDPFVLMVIAPDLDSQPPRCVQYQGPWWTRLGFVTPAPFRSLGGPLARQVVDFLLEALQLLKIFGLF